MGNLVVWNTDVTDTFFSLHSSENHLSSLQDNGLVMLYWHHQEGIRASEDKASWCMVPNFDSGRQHLGYTLLTSIPQYFHIPATLYIRLHRRLPLPKPVFQTMLAVHQRYAIWGWHLSTQCQKPGKCFYQKESNLEAIYWHDLQEGSTCSCQEG